MRTCIGIPVTICCAALALAGCVSGFPVHAPAPHLLHGIPSRASSGAVNVVIEIPAGTNAKWEVDKQSGRLLWEMKDGRPRVVQYVAYPGNYGMVPRTLLPEGSGGDGDPLDVIVLGPALDRGSISSVHIIGVLRLLDDRERDDKLIGVRPDAPLGDVANLGALDERYPGARRIIELWFSHYKGTGRLEVTGWGTREEALEILASAEAAYSVARTKARSHP